MKPYELLIFDFDGTLVDTLPDIALYAHQVLGEFGVKTPPTLEAVKKAVGRGVHELLKDLGISADQALLEEAVISFKRRYSETPVVRTKPYPGVKETLSGPLGNIKKAIVTNKPYALTIKILKELGLEIYFETVIGLDTGYPAKPDASSVNFVMTHYGIPPSKVLFIGDSSIDAETSRNAGIDFAWVNYGYDRLNGVYQPKFEFSGAYEWKSLN